MGAQDELWTSKQRLARTAVLLTVLTVAITPEDRAKIGRYASDKGPTRVTRHLAVPKATARRLKLGSHFVMSSFWDSKSTKFNTCQMHTKHYCQILYIPANIFCYTIQYLYTYMGEHTSLCKLTIPSVIQKCIIQIPISYVSVPASFSFNRDVMKLHTIT